MLARRLPTLLLALLAATLVGVWGLALGSSRATGDSLGQLNSALGAQQSRQSSLSASLSRLNALVHSLNRQISLVEERESQVQSALDTDHDRLSATRASLTREQAKIVRLRAQYTHARTILAGQLVSAYESAKPSVVSVVLEARGFSDLLDQVQYLSDAEHHQQSEIAFIRTAKAEAHTAAVKLAKLQKQQTQITEAAAARVRALAGMSALLHSRQAALARAQAAQQSALAASRARGQQLQADIRHVQAQQAAAERAAAQAPAAPATPTGTPTATGPALGPNGGWAIPYAIVLCESGGQNLSPNSAGASGYYQIIPSTWTGEGGTGPAAYLAPKSEQDAIAAKLWNNGAGASNWVCAGIVGIH